MKTLVTDSAEEAASYVRTGDLAAFPTETVYGLGGNALSEGAVRKIFAAKGRPTDNPLIVHIASTEQLAMLVKATPPIAERLIDRFFPGPLTLILTRATHVPAIVSAGLDTIGVRMPRHPAAREFLAACGTPVAAPSANLSGRPSPTSWEAVLDDLDGRIPCILKGGRSPVGLESTVVDCSTPVPIVLRAGAVSLEELRDVVPGTRPASADDVEAGRSPGTKYRHYSPRARVILVEHPPETFPEEAAFIGLDEPLEATTNLVTVCTSVEDYAHELFAFFRECDAADVREVFCQIVPETGIGLALMDRLRRASDSL